MTTKTPTKPKSLPLRLAHFSTLGNRNIQQAAELLAEVETAKEFLDALNEAYDEMERGIETYDSNDPADETTTDGREIARENRAEAYDEVQQAASNIAECIDNFIEALGMEAMK